MPRPDFDFKVGNFHFISTSNKTCVAISANTEVFFSCILSGHKNSFMGEITIHCATASDVFLLHRFSITTPMPHYPESPVTSIARTYNRYCEHGLFDKYPVPFSGEYLLSVAMQGITPIEFWELSHPLTLPLKLIVEAVAQIINHRLPDIVLRAMPVVLSEITLQVLHELASSNLNIN